MIERSRPLRPRGYLLLEVMASGAMLAIILGGTISLVASERAKIVEENRRAIATGLAQELLGILVADNGDRKHFGCDDKSVGSCAGSNCVHNPNNAADPGSATDDADPPFPGFDRYYDCEERAGSNGKLHDLEVRVTYPGAGGSIATVTAKTLRRNRW